MSELLVASGVDLDPTLSARGGHLHVEECDVVALAATFGTPLYVVSEARLRMNARSFRDAFESAWPEGPVRVLPSLKANFSLATRRILTLEGLGCDVFGPGEFRAALEAGVDPELMSLNGSAKEQSLIDDAVRVGARITLDSRAELDRVCSAARRLGARARIRLRARPDLSEITEPTDFLPEEVPVGEAARRYKAGIPTPDLLEMGRVALERSEVELTGLMVHFARHRVDLPVWGAAVRAFARLVGHASRAWDGWHPTELDLGGGVPTGRDPTGRLLSRLEDRAGTSVPSVRDYAGVMTESLRSELAEQGIRAAGIALEVEPGRSMFADTGIHVTTVRNIKREREPVPWTWVETDTTEMFLLDSLVEHNRWVCVAANRMDDPDEMTADIVGKSCGFDLMVPDARLPALHEGDVLGFLDTGAYQDASSTNFNALPRPATVLVSGADVDVIKRAETIDDVLSRDVVPDRLRRAD